MYSRYLHDSDRQARIAPRTYPLDIECIVDPTCNKGGIYLGNREAAESLATLKKLNIQGVLTAANGILLSHPKTQIPHLKYVPGEDRQTFDLSKYFDECVDWITERLQSTNILIHCMAGVSRSVTLLLAYLIKERKMRYQEAYDMVKKRRRIISPNSGFVQQLKNYERRHGRSRSPNRTPSPGKRPVSHASEYRDRTHTSLLKTSSPSQNKSPLETRYNATDFKYHTRGLSTRQAPKRPASSISNAEQSDNHLNYREKFTYMNDDLDRRIEQIRRKYQKAEYTPSTRSTLRANKYYQQISGINSVASRDIHLDKYIGSGDPFSQNMRERLRNPDRYLSRNTLNNYLLNRF